MIVQVRVPCRGLHDGRAERPQVRQVPGVDVQVHPVLDGLGLGDPVDPDRVLMGRPCQQAVAVILGLPGAAEHRSPERAEPGRVTRVQAQVFESRDRHGKNLRSP
jgi:hypothetical protein